MATRATMPSPEPRVTVLVNADCHHCTQVLDHVCAEAAAFGLPVAGVDLRRHPEAAAAWAGETSPIVVLEGLVAPLPGLRELGREGDRVAVAGDPGPEAFAALARSPPRKPL